MYICVYKTVKPDASYRKGAGNLAKIGDIL